MKSKMKMLFVLLAMLCTMALASFAGAQGQAGTSAPGVWNSAVNLQNVGSGPATVVINFYKSDGSLALTYNLSAPLAVNGALSIYVPGVISQLAPGQYSAVVSSDQPVLASVNTASTGSSSAPWSSFAYDGFDSAQAGTKLYFPGNYKNYYGFNSELVIQNAGSAAANVTATFKSAAGANLATISLGTLAPNAAKSFPMSSFSQLPSGNATGLFGAEVTSDQPLVGVANIWRTQPINATASYSGFASGGATLYVPGLYNNYFGFATALTIQNVGSTNSAGTITYSSGHTVNFDLAPGAAQAYYQPANSSLPSGNTGGLLGAKVVATSGQIVGLVSIDSLSRNTVGDFASYNVPFNATASVNIPNINSDYFGFFTAVTVQNTGSTPTNITLTYANGSTRTISNVAAGAVANFIHLNSAGDTLPDKTATSATATASNGNLLVAVVQHNTTNGVNGYDPSKRPSDYLLAVTGVNR